MAIEGKAPFVKKVFLSKGAQGTENAVKSDKKKTEKKAEPFTPEQSKEIAAEKIKESAEKKKEPEKLEKTVFPVEAKINKYGFIHVANGVATAFKVGPFGKDGVDTPITIDFKDGKLIIAKK